MRFSYSSLIEKFREVLGTPKPLIEETYNKPDLVDVIKEKYVSIKWFGDFYMLVIFEMDGESVNFLNAYRVYPKMIDVDMDKLARMRPLELLAALMNKYGIPKQLAGAGECKVFVEKDSPIFFLGILDIEKYLEALGSS